MLRTARNHGTTCVRNGLLCGSPTSPTRSFFIQEDVELSTSRPAREQGDYDSLHRTQSTTSLRRDSTSSDHPITSTGCSVCLWRFQALRSIIMWCHESNISDCAFVRKHQSGDSIGVGRRVASSQQPKTWWIVPRHAFPRLTSAEATYPSGTFPFWVARPDSFLR